MAKVIAVLGSTGTQGGGLCRAILADPSGGFSCRAITRDASKDKAQALKAAGAEVVEANLDDVESLKKAFAGAHGVYAVTNFWEHFSGQKEKDQAKNVAEAAKAAGVQHIVWSTLEDTRQWMPAGDTRMPMLQDKYRVPHFDAKAEADAYFAGLPTTFLRTSFYWDNLYMFGLAPKKNDAGQYEWTFPLGTAKMAGIGAEDIGKTAYGVFKAGSQYIGKTVGIAGEFISVDDMGQKLTKHLGHRTGEVQRGGRQRLSQLRLPRRRRDGQHVPGLSGLRGSVQRQPQHRRGAPAQSGAHELRSVGGGEQEQDSALSRRGGRLQAAHETLTAGRTSPAVFMYVEGGLQTALAQAGLKTRLYIRVSSGSRVSYGERASLRSDTAAP